MPISANQELPVFIERVKTQTISIPLYEAVLVAPDAGGTVSVFDESGTAIVDEQTITVTNGVASYSISSATVPDTLSLSDRWQIKWTLTVDSEVHTFVQDAHLVRRVLHPVISDASLTTGRHSELAGSTLKPTGVSSWQGYRDAAWTEIQQLLLERGRRPYLIMSPWSLARVHKLLSWALIYDDLSTHVQASGGYAKKADRYFARFEREWGRLSFAYDFDEDGTISDTVEGSVSSSPVTFLSKAGYYRG